MKATRYNMFVLIAAVTSMSACSVEPWVKPYERELLADPIMSFDRDPTLSRFRAHVHEVTEGAKGAIGTSRIGCGCN